MLSILYSSENEIKKYSTFYSTRIYSKRHEDVFLQYGYILTICASLEFHNPVARKKMAALAEGGTHGDVPAPGQDRQDGGGRAPGRVERRA